MAKGMKALKVIGGTKDGGKKGASMKGGMTKGAMGKKGAIKA